MLKKAYARLEKRVEEPTVELARASDELQTEIIKRKQVENAPREKADILDKRIKELDCFYGVSRLAENQDISINDLLQGIVDLIPTACRYPEIARTRIILDGRRFQTNNFKETIWKQTFEIIVQGARVGALEAFYLEEASKSDEDPFLKEERDLLNTISNQLSRIITRKRIEKSLKKYSKRLEEMVQERTAELVEANAQLKREIAERKQAEGQILRQNLLLNAINKVFEETFKCESVEDVAHTCLTVAEELTGSQFGFIGEVTSTGRFDTFAISNPGWDACKMPGSEATRSIKNMEFRGIDRSVLREEKSRIVNDPESHPDRIGTPRGHPPITSFLGVPLKNSGKTIGIIGLANKESGYDPADQKNIESLSVAFVEALNRKRSEEALRESDEKYRLLVENANDAIFIAQDGVIKFPNPKTLEIIGYSEEELSGIPFIELIHPEDRDMVLERHKRRLKGEKPPSHYSFRMIRRGGQELWVQLNTVLIIWKGRPAILNFVKDITQQRRLEAQFRQAQKMEAIGTLAGGIAHDFNNILQAMVIGTEIALFELSDRTLTPQRLKDILKACWRGSALVNQILAFSRQSEQKRQPVQINPVIKEALRMLRSSLPSTIEIRQHIRSGSALVLADPTQIHQVMMNLCTNAAYAMREKGGVLNVSLTDVDFNSKSADYHPDLKSGPYLKLSVSDTGHGMNPMTKEKIFDPFFTTKERGEGTGMGLSVVHGIIKSYGGAITVESEPGKGATFEAFFSRIESEAPVTTDSRSKEILGGDEQILVVDDEKILADSLALILAKLGYKVTPRTSSIEALEAFRTKPDKFDLVITDQTMPNMTGVDLANELVQIRSDIPIILCTGFSEIISEDAVKTMSVREFVMKPYVMAQIAEIVRQVLDNK